MNSLPTRRADSIPELPGLAPNTSPAVPKALDVVRASDLPYADFLQHYLRTNRPLIIDNAVTAWPALQKWTPHYFKQHFGEHQVQVSYTKRMAFADFVDAVLASSEQAPGPYLYRLFFHEHLPELLSDLIPQNVYGFPRRHVSPLMPERWRRPDGFLKLLMGGPGSKFPVMHYDLEHAHAQITGIYGEKEYYLFPPEDTPYLYPSPVQTNLSQIDQPHKPDLQRFPRMAQASPHHAVLKPGQMIFIPMGWWHAARPLSVSISVCTAIMDRSNWPGFVRDICAVPEGRPFKRILKRGFLASAGAVMQSMENLQTTVPGLARALVFPAKLAPISAEVSPEPSAQPLNIRIPTA
ncbi:cupin-like domain-containing protein [Thiomonas sp.]|uniref:cupin-like domain-containing protein n=1 Tax=Thiomonas sp. TaxID=2047785 RepID=UPI0025872076|nr:cupin-like domain-containing protein [Thiomonas sp.]